MPNPIRQTLGFQAVMLAIDNATHHTIATLEHALAVLDAIEEDVQIRKEAIQEIIASKEPPSAPPPTPH